MTKTMFLEQVEGYADNEYISYTLERIKLRKEEYTDFDPEFANIYAKFADVWNELNEYCKIRMEKR